MADNPYSALDSVTLDDNPYSALDSVDLDAKEPEKGGLGGHAKDAAIKLGQGAIDLGQQTVGLSNMLSVGQDAVMHDALGFKSRQDANQRTPYQPEQAKAALGTGLSDTQKQQDANFANAHGLDKFGAAVENPLAVSGAALESVPSMLAGMGLTNQVAAGIFAKAAEAAGGIKTEAGIAAGKAAVEQAASKLIGVSSGTEGAMSAGGIAEEAQRNGKSWGEYAPKALGAGLATGAIGYGSGKLFGDAATDLAAGTHTMSGGVPGKIAKGIATEGIAEEAPQSASETAFTNSIYGRPLSQGVADSAIEGGIVGGAMGGVMGSGVSVRGSSAQKRQSDLAATASTGALGKSLAAAGITNKDVDYEQHFSDAAEANGLPLDYLKAVAQVESGAHQFDANGNPTNPGTSNALGVMQIIPKWHPQFDPNKLATDAEYNIHAGAKILSDLFDQTDPSLPVGERLRIASKRYYGHKDDAQNEAYANKVGAAMGGATDQWETPTAKINPDAEAIVRNRTVPGQDTQSAIDAQYQDGGYVPGEQGQVWEPPAATIHQNKDLTGAQFDNAGSARPDLFTADNRGATELNNATPVQTGSVTNETNTAGLDNEIPTNTLQAQPQQAPGSSYDGNAKAFTPTHELNDGTPVIQTGRNKYADKDGYEWGPIDARPIATGRSSSNSTAGLGDKRISGNRSDLSGNSQQDINLPASSQNALDAILTKSKGAYLASKAKEFSQSNPNAIAAAKKQNADRVRASYDDELNRALASAPFDVYAKHPSNKGVPSSILRQSYDALRQELGASNNANKPSQATAKPNEALVNQPDAPVPVSESGKNAASQPGKTEVAPDEAKGKQSIPASENSAPFKDGIIAATEDSDKARAEISKSPYQEKIDQARAEGKESVKMKWGDFEIRQTKLDGKSSFAVVNSNTGKVEGNFGSPETASIVAKRKSELPRPQSTETNALSTNSDVLDTKGEEEVTDKKLSTSKYKTISSLLKATEKILQSNSSKHIDGQSKSMWLHNAEYIAEENFKAGDKIRELRKKYSISRPQDLASETGGHSVFGFQLPKRGYVIGDNVPGVGSITDAVNLKDGYKQFQINGQWYHETSIDQDAVDRMQKAVVEKVQSKNEKNTKATLPDSTPSEATKANTQPTETNASADSSESQLNENNLKQIFTALGKNGSLKSASADLKAQIKAHPQAQLIETVQKHWSDVLLAVGYEKQDKSDNPNGKVFIKC
ncbi:MAG: transglycosylase SLT domain-containing protein [Methylobacter sp.]